MLVVRARGYQNRGHQTPMNLKIALSTAVPELHKMPILEVKIWFKRSGEQEESDIDQLRSIIQLAMC